MHASDINRILIKASQTKVHSIGLFAQFDRSLLKSQLLVEDVVLD